MIRFNSYSYGSRMGYSSGNSLYRSLSQLSSVRSGSYFRALRSYYGTNNRTSATQRSTAVNNRNAYGLYGRDNDLANVSKESQELSAAAKRLTGTGKNGLFANREKYDADAAYKAASDLVTNYNETLDAAGKTANSGVGNAVGSMKRVTGALSKNLDEIGISVGKDGRMSIDEGEFKSAGFDEVKSMLGAKGSFSGIVDSSAQRLSSVAEQQNRQMSLSNGGLYDRYGSYSRNYGLSGSLFDGLF